jgi:coenzyme PQQ biosynthesis protein PqqD
MGNPVADFECVRMLCGHTTRWQTAASIASKAAMRDAERPHRRDGFLLQELDDEILLYHPEQTRAVYMNATATLIWGLCDGATSVAEIIGLLEQSFPDAVDIAADVRATLQRFAQHGAIAPA